MTGFIDNDGSDHVYNNPILLIGHSMGSIIIQQLIINAEKGQSGSYNFHDEYYQIYQRIQGNIFYGTPHSGSYLESVHSDIPSSILFETISNLIGYKTSDCIEHTKKL